jgi:hypothetical protein
MGTPPVLEISSSLFHFPRGRLPELGFIIVNGFAEVKQVFTLRQRHGVSGNVKNRIRALAHQEVLREGYAEFAVLARMELEIGHRNVTETHSSI